MDLTRGSGLFTVWGETLDRDCPLPEYPRPQFVRPRWLCLNGRWNYEIRPDGETPRELSGSILVPFSPEAPLSGAARGPREGETAWYGRDFTLPENFLRDRLLLNFGAVDQWCEVFVNGRSAGVHEGGYEPFTLDITALTDPAGVNRLVVAVRDATEAGADMYGKQSRSPGTIWYTAQSGIWQTVWLESVPDAYLTGVRLLPDFDAGVLRLEVDADGEEVAFAVLAERKVVARGVCGPDGRGEAALPDFRPWSPEDPFLYDLLLLRGKDLVKSYFAMRKISAREGQLLLNNKPVFLSGLLDQGYWPDGLYTPPSDEAMVFDIERAKDMGFNLLRKHVKTEPLRWYYHCDRLGMLVWQDFPNGGEPYLPLWTSWLPLAFGLQLPDRPYSRFGRKYARGRSRFEAEAEGIVRTLRNCPSIICWCIFNEGWGQFETRHFTELVRSWDPSRLLEPASGWHDQGTGDFCSRHIYFKKLGLKPDPQGRIQAITEYGGYSLTLAGHTSGEKSFGYRKMKDRAQLQQALRRLWEEQLIPLKEKGLAVSIFTQLSDVEQEHNGLLTWDRKEAKVDAALMRELNRKLTGPAAAAERSD